MIVDILSEIFLNINDCREFLLENEIIQQNIYCPKCETIAELGKSTLLNLNKIEYRCKRSGCQKRIRISSSKIPLTKLLHLIYLLLNDINYKTLYLYHGVADATIASLKKAFELFQNLYLEQTLYLGNPNVILEVDETVLLRRGIVRSPTGYDDTILDTVWILGVVEKEHPKNFFIKRIEN